MSNLAADLPANEKPFFSRPFLAFGYCHHLCVCPCVCVYQSLACPLVCVSIPCSSAVQARITKFGSEVQNTLVKIPIIKSPQSGVTLYFQPAFAKLFPVTSAKVTTVETHYIAIFTSHQSNLADVVFRNIGNFSSI